MMKNTENHYLILNGLNAAGDDAGQGCIESYVDNSVLKLIVEENEYENSFEPARAEMYLTRDQAYKLANFLLKYAEGK